VSLCATQALLIDHSRFALKLHQSDWVPLDEVALLVSQGLLEAGAEADTTKGEKE
jgi:hypothetical protein